MEQFVKLIVSKKLMCRCGQIARFIILDKNISSRKKQDFEYTMYCPTCWQTAVENKEDLEPHGLVVGGLE